MKEKHTEEMIRHMTSSTHALSNLLRANKDACVRLSGYICSDTGALASQGSSLTELDKVKQLNGSVISYLNSISGLSETMADQLEMVMQQLSEQEDEE